MNVYHVKANGKDSYFFSYEIIIFILIKIFREVSHDIQDLKEACQDPTTFLESTRVDPMTRCSCPIIMDFIENDVRLCLDDMLDEIVIRTTVN